MSRVRPRGGTRLGPVLLLLPAPLLLACAGDGTGPGGPMEAPQVVARQPSPGAAGVSVLTVLTVTFDGALDPASAAGGLTLTEAGRPLRGTTSLADDSTLRFVPASPLDFGTTLEARVNGSVLGRGGTPVAGSGPWTFRTEGTLLPAIPVDSLRARVAVLAHDTLRGRGSGTDDERRAADYLAGLLTGAGTLPLNGLREQAFTAAPSGSDATVRSQNVLGVVPGVGPLADEWIVVGGHYDHLGVRVTDGGALEVFNGADDNASGTAVVMEMARLYAAYVGAGAMAGPSRRSVLFAAWGAEELGLLGSCHFVDSGLLPAARVDGLLNFDMVGRLRPGSAEALGWESSPAWTDLLSDANPTDLAFDNTTVCQSCSDHACFRRRDVPYLSFFTGWHDQYHQPDDDAATLDYDGMARILDIGLRLLTRLAVTETPPEFSGDPTPMP